MRTIDEWRDERRQRQGKATYQEHVVGARNVYADLMLLGHDEDFEPTVPADPTTALPGTLEKVEILARRVELGQPLWHPSDVQTFDDARLVAIGGAKHINPLRRAMVFTEGIDDGSSDETDDWK